MAPRNKMIIILSLRMEIGEEDKDEGQLQSGLRFRAEESFHNHCWYISTLIVTIPPPWTLASGEINGMLIVIIHVHCIGMHTKR
jgi:hypothetical protein